MRIAKLSLLTACVIIGACGGNNTQTEARPDASAAEGGTTAGGGGAGDAQADAHLDTGTDGATVAPDARIGEDVIDASMDPDASGAGGSVPMGDIQFVGDWESQNTNQWTHELFQDPAQFEIVTAPRRQGDYAALFRVRPGDKYKTFSGERSEVSIEGRQDLFEGDGDTFYYGWSTYFPPGWEEPNGWAIFCQWHAFTHISPPIAFQAADDGIYVTFNTGDVTGWWPAEYGEEHQVSGTLSRGSWNDFIVKIAWNPDWFGSIDVWHRVEGQDQFEHVVSLDGIPTLQWSTDMGQFWNDGVALPWGPGWYSKSYLQYGFYRGEDASIVNVVYQDGFARGTTWDVIRSRFP